MKASVDIDVSSAIKTDSVPSSAFSDSIHGDAIIAQSNTAPLNTTPSITALSITVPLKKEFERWVNMALQSPIIKPLPKKPEISIRVIGINESQMLNKEYRDKDKPTNVLSFPAEFPEGTDIPLLGDLAICATVVAQEAIEQGKEIKAHWAHMTIHGTLHLMGYDHIDDHEADIMETIEISLLQSLTYPNPYTSK